MSLLKEEGSGLILKLRGSRPPVPGQGAGSTAEGLMGKCPPPHSTLREPRVSITLSLRAERSGGQTGGILSSAGGSLRINSPAEK